MYVFINDHLFPFPFIYVAVGRGIYFATEAQISHGYTTPDTRGHRHMFMGTKVTVC